MLNQGKYRYQPIVSSPRWQCWPLAVLALGRVVASHDHSGDREAARKAREPHIYFPNSSDIKGVDRGKYPRTIDDPRLEGFNFNDERHGFAARQPISLWQLYGFVAFFGVVVGAGLVDYRLPITLSMVALTAAFLIVVFVRAIALKEIDWFAPSVMPSIGPVREPDQHLPLYSILVALYREAASVPQLVDALAAIDYPHSRLDIIFVVEPDDAETYAALLARRASVPFRIVVASNLGPKTKPKALNCALSYVVGDFVVIYDAEDRPEPDQLRKVIEVYRCARWAESALSNAKRPRLVCVQAELNVYNVRDSWLTRQFAIEYTLLFGAILPAFARMGWPVPLGGTSNHFETQALLELGGWDPYNVTEDADLGIRIARAGKATTIVRSTTWEEAPRAFSVWYRQRTRWIKGWLVTFLVHTKAPRDLVRDLGLRQTIGMLLVLGSMLLSAFCNPLALIGMLGWAVSTWGVDRGAVPLLHGNDEAGSFMQIVFIVAVANFIIGYGAAMLTAAMTTHRRHRRLAWYVFLMPVYWLLVSCAAVRAAWQLIREPHKWEKTPHGEGQP